MLKEIKKTSECWKVKRMLEGCISEFLNAEAKIQNAWLRGRDIIFWADEFSNGQYNQIKKQGTIEEVLMEIDVDENFFVNFIFKLTGGSMVLLAEVEEIK